MTDACRECSVNPISHKRKGLCTSCYAAYRQARWSTLESIRLSDPEYSSQRKAYKASYFQKHKRYLYRRCSRCGLDAIKGSRLCLCSTCSKEHLSNRKNQYQASRKKLHINTRIRENVKSRLKKAFVTGKDVSILKIIGCSIDELKSHLESKFYVHPVTNSQMTWENYGIKGWHIDHVKPLVKFNLSDHEEFKKAFHFTNLQPLWAEDNWKKSDKYEQDG